MSGVVFERTLAHGVCVGYLLAADADVADLPPELARRLHPAEIGHALAWPAPRARAWLAGRLALRLALERSARAVPSPVLSTPAGAPLLPPTVAASISHKATSAGMMAVALVGPPGSGPVGIDLEVLSPEHPDLEAGVLSPAESAALRQAPPSSRWTATLTRFCLKEAAFKALDPTLPCRLDLREVAAWPLPTGSARLDWPATYGIDPARLDAHWLGASPYLLATAHLRSGAPLPA